MKKPVDLFEDFWKHPRYEYCYILVDIHNTVFKPSFDKPEEFEYFPLAKQCLQELSNNSKVKLIFWSGCYPDKIEMYLKHFEENGIHFDYVNENPECENSSYACLDKKFYFDLGFDDRFGFEGNIDWKELYPIILKTNYEKLEL